MLDNKEEFELKYENIQKLFKLVIGSFKIEARFLYKELEELIKNGDDTIFDNNKLKSDLLYSRTALLYYL